MLNLKTPKHAQVKGFNIRWFKSFVTSMFWQPYHISSSHKWRVQQCSELSLWHIENRYPLAESTPGWGSGQIATFSIVLTALSNLFEWEIVYTQEKEFIISVLINKLPMNVFPVCCIGRFLNSFLSFYCFLMLRLLCCWIELSSFLWRSGQLQGHCYRSIELAD